MNLRKKLKSYPEIKQNLHRLKCERDACLEPFEKFRIDIVIEDTERQIDTILTQIGGISDEYSKAVILEHFIDQKPIREISRELNYSVEWVYKKIAKGIIEIEEDSND